MVLLCKEIIHHPFSPGVANTCAQNDPSPFPMTLLLIATYNTSILTLVYPNMLIKKLEDLGSVDHKCYNQKQDPPPPKTLLYRIVCSTSEALDSHFWGENVPLFSKHCYKGGRF